MHKFIVVKTEESLSLKSNSTNREISIGLEKIPVKVLLQIDSFFQPRASKSLSKPLCKSGVISVESDSEVYKWFISNQALVKCNHNLV